MRRISASSVKARRAQSRKPQPAVSEVLQRRPNLGQQMTRQQVTCAGQSWAALGAALPPRPQLPLSPCGLTQHAAMNHGCSLKSSKGEGAAVYVQGRP